MCPWLEFSLGGHAFRWPLYPLLLSLAFAVAYWDTLRRAVATRQNPRLYERAFLTILAASLIGGRLYYALFIEFAYFHRHPLDVFRVWEGGSVFYGSLLASLAALWVFARLASTSFARLTDTMAPSLFLGIAIGRFACLAAGCCWGRPTDAPWAIVYRHPDALSSLKFVPVHPAPIYESLGAVLLWRVLSRRSARPDAQPGALTWRALAAYALLRFIVEYFRGDDVRGFIVPGLLSSAQFLSLTILAIALAQAMRRAR